MDLQGAAGVITDPAAADAAGRFQAMWLGSPGMRIAGGTDEILRNIIAERVLGLPGDIRVDKDVPFNEDSDQGTLSNANLILRSRAWRGVSKDEVASWFKTA